MTGETAASCVNQANPASRRVLIEVVVPESFRGTVCRVASRRRLTLSAYIRRLLDDHEQLRAEQEPPMRLSIVESRPGFSPPMDPVLRQRLFSKPGMERQVRMRIVASLSYRDRMRAVARGAGLSLPDLVRNLAARDLENHDIHLPASAQSASCPSRRGASRSARLPPEATCLPGARKAA